VLHVIADEEHLASEVGTRHVAHDHDEDDGAREAPQATNWPFEPLHGGG
jgi:hypothetical protein